MLSPIGMLIFDRGQTVTITETTQEPYPVDTGVCGAFEAQFAKAKAGLDVSKPVFNLQAALVIGMDLLSGNQV